MMRCRFTLRLSFSLFLRMLLFTRFPAWRLFMLTAEGMLGTLVKEELLPVKFAYFLWFLCHVSIVSSLQVLPLTIQDTLLKPTGLH